MKIVKAELDNDAHADFKSWCAKRGTTMGRQIHWWITNNCLGEVGKVPEIQRVEPKPVNAVVPLVGKVGKPFVDEVVDNRTCFKCKAKVQKWTMDSRGKPWCDDCLEDARNAIP